MIEVTLRAELVEDVMTIRPCALALLSLLVACKTVTPVRIQLFGDSTQWGYDPTTHHPVAQPPVALLQAAMDARFGTGKVIVTERAAPGTTSSDLLAGTDDRNRPWPSEVNADIVVVNHALNDSHDGIPLATYRANLVRFHATVYETPNPVTVAWPEAPYAAAMREVAASLHAPVADVETWMRAQPNWQALLVSDGIHPTSEGYRRIVNDVLMPTLAPLVAALLK
jgi:lysophospholipase L1-like esterase